MKLFRSKRIVRYKIYELVGNIALLIKLKPKGIIFIIGTGRCGSTLFQNILNTSNSLCVFPGEANEYFHPELYPFSKDKISILDDPRKFSEISEKNWDKVFIKLNKLFLGYLLLKGNNKPLVVKSAMISFLSKQLSNSYPQSKFIHLYRNAIPVINSIEKKEWIKHKNHYSNKSEFRKKAAHYWNDCIVSVFNFQKEIDKSRFFEVSYEFLCVNSKKALQDISLFINIKNDFETDKIEIHKSKSENTSEYNSVNDCFSIVKETLLLKGYIK